MLPALLADVADGVGLRRLDALCERGAAVAGAEAAADAHAQLVVAGLRVEGGAARPAVVAARAVPW